MPFTLSVYFKVNTHTESRYIQAHIHARARKSTHTFQYSREEVSPFCSPQTIPFRPIFAAVPATAAASAKRSVFLLFFSQLALRQNSASHQRFFSHRQTAYRSYYAASHILAASPSLSLSDFRRPVPPSLPVFRTAPQQVVLPFSRLRPISLVSLAGVRLLHFEAQTDTEGERAIGEAEESCGREPEELISSNGSTAPKHTTCI